jgi:2-C-methyl-D-erythritol 4-phosphate cytidylyltransferase
MGVDCPKQYLPLIGAPVLSWSLRPLLAEPRIRAVVLAVAPDELRVAALPEAGNPKLQVVAGGAERQDSVRAGLTALAGQAAEQDWVLVHDAARPCLHPDDLGRLMACTGDATFPGGLLAAPVADTLKRTGGDGRVAQTICRDGLWRALTPQMFRWGALLAALAAAERAGVRVTDEAQAMERLGHAVALVPGRSDNLKITHPEDLVLAQAVLVSRGAMESH